MSLRTWLFRITLCLVLGVVTTVGVAWGCARFAYRTGGAHEVRTSTIRQLSVEEESELLEFDSSLSVEIRDNLIGISESSGIGFLRTTWYRMPRWWFQPPNSGGGGSGGPLAFGGKVACGWPLLNFICDESQIGGTSTTSQLSYEPALMIDVYVKEPGPFQGGYVQRPLPTRPLVLSTAVNILFYATIWFVLQVPFGRVKRWNRKRRGLCPRCKYNLRGNREGVTGCSECGWGREDFTAESPPEGARSEDSSSFEEQQA